MRKEKRKEEDKKKKEATKLVSLTQLTTIAF